MSKKSLLILHLTLSAFTLLNGQTDRLKIRAVGDIMLGTATPTGFLRPPEKGSILKYIQPELLNADLTMGNLEGILCDTGTSNKCNQDSLDCYLFRMQESEGENLKASGFDFLSLANNHVRDFGSVCLTRTEFILDSLGIGWSGRAGTFSSRRVKGSNIAFVAFHSGGDSNSSLDIPNAVKWIRHIDQTHDIVIISIHGGPEGRTAMHMPDSMEYYLGEARGEMIKFAHAMVDAGADMIFGHGPHVARGMEIYKGRPIAYSLGNFATYGRFNLQEERRFGGILELVFDPKGGIISGQILSIEQKYWGVPFLDPQHRFVHLVDSLSQEDLAENRARFSTEGKLILK